MDLLGKAIQAASPRRLWAPMLGSVGLHLLGASRQDAIHRPSLVEDAAETVMHHFSPDILFPVMDIFVESRAIKQALKRRNQPCALDASGIAALAELSLSHLTSLAPMYDVSSNLCQKYRQHCPTAIFVTAPFTLATLLAGTFPMQESMLEQPQLAHVFLQQTTRLLQKHITRLMAGGCTLLCLLDPFASLLHCNEYRLWAGRPTATLISDIDQSGATAILHICGNTSAIIPAMAATGAHGLSLDSAQAGIDLAAVANSINSVVIGNLNPLGTLLTGTAADVAAETLNLLASMKEVPNFIFSAGCEFVAQTPLPNIRAMAAATRYTHP